MPRQIHKLSPAESEIIARSQDDARYFTDFYFDGWLFDDNITPEWQLKVHHAKQKEITVIGGIGSGKSLAIGMSAAVWCATTHSFKFMGVAPTLYQAAQMFQMILERAEGNRFERFIWKTVSKPYPKITLKHSGIKTSTLEFMSAADDANRILAWEGDWINVDEAGLLDNIDETIIRLGTRLRGNIRGRSRLGRLSLTTNPHVNPQLYYRFDLAKEMPEAYLSVQVPTQSNKNITDEQIESLVRRIPEHERDRWLKGDRPEGEGREFPMALVEPCEDDGLDAIMHRGLNLEEAGFIEQRAPKAGVVRWELPHQADRRYIVVMDPGQGVPPYRNAPVITVWDITEFPVKPMTLQAFWWGYGDGSYQPCIQQFKDYFQIYKASFGVYYSTGTQTGMGEYFRLEDELLVYGISLAGNTKGEAILSLKLFMGRQLIRWPKSITGIHQQLLSYRLPDRKVVQDIVSNFQISALFARRFYYVDEDTPNNREVPYPELSRFGRIPTDRYERSHSR